MRCLQRIWQFPIFSVIFAVIVAVSSVMMYSEADKLSEALKNATGEDKFDFKMAFMWTLIGIFIIDGAITFMSIVTSEWVYTCCWDQKMQSCTCCTQFVCYTLNWFLFLMAYLLGIVSTVITGVGTFTIFFGIMSSSACPEDTTGWNDTNTNTLKAAIDPMLAKLNAWFKDNCLSGMPCDKFPAAIDTENAKRFCDSVNDIYGLGGKFFALVALVVISQWSFALIQRANLVEGAARRDMAKKQNQQGGVEAVGGGPHV